MTVCNRRNSCTLVFVQLLVVSWLLAVYCGSTADGGYLFHIFTAHIKQLKVIVIIASAIVVVVLVFVSNYYTLFFNASATHTHTHISMCGGI